MIGTTLYRVSRKRIKPVYSGFVVATLVVFYHLYISNLDFWNVKNIFLAVMLTILSYVGALGLSASIVKLGRSTIDEKEKDLTWGKKS